MSAGNRGKWAEGQVRDELTALSNAVAGFCFNRIPDAHGGNMQPADGDFQWFFNHRHSCTYDQPNHLRDTRTGMQVIVRDFTRNGVIEVKEVEHLTRLPHSNFSADKITRVYKRQLAGCEAIVLVAHKLKGMRRPDVTWRAVNLQFFRDTVYTKGVASWDLSDFPHVSLPAVIKGLVR